MPFCVLCVCMSNRWALIFFSLNTRSKKRGSYFPKLFYRIKFGVLWLLRKRNKPAATEPFANERFCNEWFCLPEPGLLVFLLWNVIASWDTPLSLHHLGTSREQRAASAEQTACRPCCLTTILPTALSAGCHDSMGKTPVTKTSLQLKNNSSIARRTKSTGGKIDSRHLEVSHLNKYAFLQASWKR